MWLEHHKRSEYLAAEAEIAARRGDASVAKKHYGESAKAEELAVEQVEPSKVRTLGILAVSAVALHFKASQLEQAQRCAYLHLGNPYIPGFAAADLRVLLQSIWSELARKGNDRHFSPGQVVVSVKGGAIIEGGAPLDLTLEIFQTLKSLIYRTAEWLHKIPHRQRGQPAKKIQENWRPWLFQTPPGSYQFAVAFERPKQRKLFPEEIDKHLLQILQATTESPEETLPGLVESIDYQNTFLKLTRNLTPTDERFTQLDMRTANGTGPSITICRETKTIVNEAIQSIQPPAPECDEKTISGILRTVHLDKRWIELSDKGGTNKRIDRVQDTVDDVIGPMINRNVDVRVADHGNKLRFLDIELTDLTAKVT